MASLGIDGLVSGLDTTALINSLMAAEAAPQTLLKSKQTSTTTLATALQALNARVASLAESATKAAKVDSWNATAATASATSVTATTTTGAQPTALTFTVDAVAQSQVSLTQPFKDLVDLTGGASTLTIRKQDGTLTEIAVGTDAAATARAISSSSAGVSAVAVTVNGETRLQLTGTSTGASGGFTVLAGTKAQVEAGTATPIGLTGTRTAQDAKITLWPGSGAAQQVSSATNAFTDVLAGTSITVSKLETDPVTLTVATDTAALTKLASDLVGSLGVVLSEISSRSAATTTTTADGRTAVTGGLFSGDSAVRGIQQQLATAASYGVDGVSPSSVGITVDRYGAFTFDDKVFAAALAADPEKVQKVVAGLAQRVADVATGTSDKIDGTLTLKIKGQQGMVTDLGKQIEEWDRRLAMRREALAATYSALEVTLSGLNSQSSWLSSQLASLSTSS
ncbi:flagellar filament capping protein FliD [Cellulomonas fengjieae]|uniref:Flagellar hook-associated protein 2 n=1 Tax=Cellulomonas fengjieae TaxID=2819978 RepID=A0ABS3SGR5_9CELL|nr:flagellar filament capping protein FliD [Cellulomonas fengjieae]MBO3084946.1 flagellar filament capping protein FliD [Cellulomonas fengjieae]QVI66453.1 flagellar filament capping protein FliD [Cellulomonas fengjieae]